MNSSTYKMFHTDNMYNLYILQCITMIIYVISIVISSSYKTCISIIQLSIVLRIIMRFRTWHGICSLRFQSYLVQPYISKSKNNCTMRLLGRFIKYSIIETMKSCIILVRIYLIQ